MTVDGARASRCTPGETLGIVGESGSGKTMTSLAIMGLLPRGGAQVHRLDQVPRRRAGRAASDDELRELRGNDIAMVFQDPLTALNPVMTVGDQLVEAMRVHHGLAASRAGQRRRAVELLDLVGIPSPAAASSSTRTSSPAACGSG